MSHAGLFRIFEGPLQELAGRGHEVRLSLDSERYHSVRMDDFVTRTESITAVRTPEISDRWVELAHGVRAGRSYLRYLEPTYATAPKLSARALNEVPRWLRPAVANTSHPARAERWLAAVDARLPVSDVAMRFLREQGVDAVAVTPQFGWPSQAELLRAARVLGLPTCLLVASWDNLTSKGLILPVPDRVVVWNDLQRQEAVALHRVGDGRVVVTGAQTFDEWFVMEPSSPRGEFLRRVGLRVDRPYLLYLGSSGFIAPDESRFVEKWLQHLRSHRDHRLREVGVLIRPHPQNANHWNAIEMAAAPQVAFYPPPADAAQVTRSMDWSRADAYDSMAHAAAVVGVNTTAMMEAAIVGRPVYTMLTPAFAATQEGTPHFEHLRSAGGGLLHLSSSFDEHFAGLAKAVGGSTDERSSRFVETFVRPLGIDQPAAPLVVDALEQTARLVTRGTVPGRPGILLRPAARLSLAVRRAGIVLDVTRRAIRLVSAARRRV